MNISTFFKLLKAQLKNQRTSWGAARPADGSIVLRCFADEFEGNMVKLMGPDWQTNNERKEHIDAIRSGSPAYVILCHHADVDAGERIAGFDKRELRYGTQLIDRDGCTYLQLTSRISAMDLQ